MEHLTPNVDCGLTIAREVLNGKWKITLISFISAGIQRPSDLHRAIATASKRVLNQQLKELEMHGIVNKKIYHQLPPKVEYSLTSMGRSFMPIVEAINTWGNQNRECLEKVTVSL
jgi:DNA-binding HxlR family transcriptional regulator